MRCEDARQAIIDAAAGAEASAALRLHLVDCAECLRLNEETQDAVGRLRSLPWPNVDRDVLDLPGLGGTRGRSQLGDGAKRLHGGGAWTPAWLSGVRPVDVGLLAVVLLAIVTGAMVIWSAPSVRPSSVDLNTASLTPTESPTPAFTPTPQGTAPTRVESGRLPEVFGVVSSPVTIEVSATWPGEQPQPCSELVIDLGDGSSEHVTCPEEKEAEGMPQGGYPAWMWSSSMARWSVSHIYDTPNVYVPQLRMTLADGGTVVQSVAQVYISRAVEQGPWDQGVDPWRWFVAGALVLCSLWAARRSTVAGGRLLAVSGTLLVLAVLLVVTQLVGGRIGRSSAIEPYLQAMVGLKGLEPLDPESALSGYRVVNPYRAALGDYVDVEFRYDDGRSESSEVPLEVSSDYFVFNRYLWRDGLGRLRAEHRELPGLPFADLGRDGIQLGDPVRIGDGLEFDAGRDAWFDSLCLTSGNLLASPDGQWVLTAYPRGDTLNLRVAHLSDGTTTDLYTGDPLTYMWLGDSRSVLVATGLGDSGHGLVRFEHTGGTWSRSDVRDVRMFTRPGAADGSVWYADEQGIWAYQLAADPPLVPGPRMVSNWPSADASTRPILDGGNSRVRSDSLQLGRALVSASPDLQHVAYNCQAGLCIMNLPRGVVTFSPGSFEAVVWSPDSTRMAAVETAPTNWRADDDRKRWLQILDAEGIVLSRTMIAPNGSVEPLQWSADGNRLFLTTCPHDGRRIVTVNARTGGANDLSQPRWDAWGTYLVPAHELVVGNGRGGLWRVPVVASRQ